MSTPEESINAIHLLDAAAGHMRDRAATYDKPEGERSMAQTVTIFNQFHGTSITEAQGWHLMQILKDVRLFAREGYHGDSAEDCVAYAALKAEAKAKEVKPAEMDDNLVYPAGKIWHYNRWVAWEPTALRTFPMLPEGARIRVRLRDGKESQEGQGFDPVDYDWSRADTPRDTDLVAYMLLKPDDTEWIFWKPTTRWPRPNLDRNALVRIRLRDGNETPVNTGLLARALEWGHAEEGQDIVAYTLLK